MGNVVHIKNKMALDDQNERRLKCAQLIAEKQSVTVK